MINDEMINAGLGSDIEMTRESAPRSTLEHCAQNKGKPTSLKNSAVTNLIAFFTRSATPYNLKKKKKRVK